MRLPSAGKADVRNANLASEVIKLSHVLTEISFETNIRDVKLPLGSVISVPCLSSGR